MRPRRLRLENFTCFRDVQEVDLSELRLFAIAGPTGAGKSSLLDAVVFALYGRIPRLGARKLDEFISLGTTSASVTLEFELGSARYRVARRMRRSGQKTAILERVQGSEAVGIADGVRQVNDAVERLLGLGSEAFLQSVVLPQGEFARFLQSDPSERRKILQELLRLQVYEEMRRRSERRRGRLWGRLETLRERLDADYAEATPEALEQAEHEAVELREELESANENRGRVEVELNRLEERWKLTEERREKQARLERAEARKPEIATLRARLDLARKAETVRPYLEIWEKAEREHQANLGERDKAREALEAAESASREVEEGFVEAADAAGEIPNLREELAELQQVLPLVAVIKEKRAAARRLTAESETARRDATANAASAARSEGLIAEIEAEGRELESLRSATGFDAALLGRLALAEDEARQILRDRERHGDCVAKLRGELEPGQACPVCDRPVKALLAPVPGQMSLGLELEAALDGVLRQSPEEKILTQLRGQREAQEEHRRLEAARGRVELRLSEARAALGQARQAEQAAAALADMRAAAAREAADAAKELARRIRADIGDVESSRAALESRIEDLEKGLEEARRRREGVRLELARGRERAAGAEDNVASSARAVEESRSRVSLGLNTAGFDSLDSLRRGLPAPGEQASLESRIRSADEEVRLLKPRLAELDEWLGDSAPTPADVEALRKSFDDAKAGCERLQIELGRLSNRLERLRRDVAQAERLRAERAQFEKEHGLFRQLADELAGARFQAYLLDDAFGRLVAGASQRLFGLTDRYELEFRNREFTVIDREHGRESRSADTLSGGETFLASLALALELIQQVQQAAGAVRLDSIFIDEGFGALDPETLDIVADTIENLDDGERMVGVITHVAELHNRLPSRIEVIPGAEGSTLRLSHS